ncbi:MAG TPA: ABC transporter permease [Candidatus Acidoferrum sp.]|jgi:predicted permease
MGFLRTIASRLLAVFRRRHQEKALDKEFSAHLEMCIEEKLRGGMTLDDARRAARREFGGVEQAKESYRQQRGLPFLETLAQDLRYAFRMLMKSPGFAAVTILTLALGIGANTAIFSMVNSVLLNNLPVRHPEELVLVKHTDARSTEPVEDFSYPMYRELRDKNTVFSALLTRARVDFNATYSGQSERAIGELVSGNYFEGLGVQPWLGRLITSDDDRTPGASSIAVLSYGYWQRRFGGDRSIVGKTILLDGKPIQIIGVTPPKFYGTDLARNPDIRVPMMMVPVFRPVPANRLQNPRHSWLVLMARRKPDVTLAQAQASLNILYHQTLNDELEQFGSRITARNREKYLANAIHLDSGNQGFAQLRHSMERPLLLLFGVTCVVLLVACANLANLLLARSAKRRQEIAVRLAIGAGRRRLVRQWLTESLLLSTLGGLAGIMVAVWAKSALVNYLPAEFRENLQSPLDARVLGFLLLASIVTGLLFGLAPALQISRASVSSTLRSETPSATSGEQLVSLRSALIFTQVALSLPLLIGAALFLHSLQNLRGIDTGFVKQNVFLANLNPSLNGYPQERIKTLYDDLLSRVRALPGVQAASLTTSSVVSGSWDRETVRVQGYVPRTDEDMSPNAGVISPSYFATLGIPLVAGRDFTAQDTAARPKVAIVNETFARYFFGNTDPLGKKIGLNDSPQAPLDIEIVGVVKDAKYVRLQEKPLRYFYTAMAQEPILFDMTLQVRTTGDSRNIADMVRAQVRDLDPNLPLYATTTLEIQIDDSLTEQRLVTWLTSLFGLLATLLAAIGLSGVVAFSVARRTREIGIRVALGAQKRDVLRLVIGRMAMLVSSGMLVGLIAAYAATRLLGSMLYEVGSADPAAFAGASCLLAAVAAVAAYLPAQRATRVDPLVALRYE